MDAFLLVAGYGKRLGDAAQGKPKPLVDIAGRPLLTILIEKLILLGIDHIYMNAHHLAEQIVQFREDSPHRELITILHEEKLLGTAGTIRNFLKFREKTPLIIMHGDNFFQDDLKTLFKAFQTRGPNLYGVVGTFISPDPENCGIFEIDKDYIIQELHEKQKPQFGNLANSAIYILDSNALELIHNLPDDLSDFSRDVLPRLLGKIVAVPLDGFFIDIGSPNNLHLAKIAAMQSQSSIVQD